jgi:aldehyde:ferredoxin oxidoreductase
MIKKRSSRMAFSQKRKPSSRLKRVLQKIRTPNSEDISDDDSFKSSISPIQKLKKHTRTRSKSRRLDKLMTRRNVIKKNENENKGNENDTNYNNEEAEEILQKMFKNEEIKGESNIRTRRRFAYEKKNLQN